MRNRQVGREPTAGAGFDKLNRPGVDKLNRPGVDKLNRPGFDKLNQPVELVEHHSERLPLPLGQQAHTAPMIDQTRTQTVVSDGSRPSTRSAELSSTSPAGTATGSWPKLVQLCSPADEPTDGRA